jgi:hypothetical protein
MTNVRRLLGALACLALAAVPCAHAASSSASITNLKIQVIDLTPGDNNTAGYVFVESSGLGSAANANVQGAPFDYQTALGYLAPVSASATASGSSGQSRVNANGVHSQAATTEMSSVDTVAEWFAESAGVTPAFVIAPFTELIITAHYVDLASIDHLGCDPSCVSVRAVSEMFSSNNVVHDNFDQGVFLNSAGATDLTQTVEGDFTSTVANNFNGTLNHRLVLETEALIQFAAAPVPEPSEMVLMLLGMGIVGAMVRGRRRSALHWARPKCRAARQGKPLPVYLDPRVESLSISGGCHETVTAPFDELGCGRCISWA